jgi:hypothetical protein
MNLTEAQEDEVQQRLMRLGAKGNVLHELTEHWCVQVNLEMNFGTPFSAALDKVVAVQSEKATLLISEINELRFPYFISERLVKITGIISLLILSIGIIIRVTRHPGIIGLLLPGYLLTAYVFLPLWFLRRLYIKADKVASTLIFLNLLSLAHLLVLWMNNARPKWVALLSWVILAIFWLLYYLKRKRRTYPAH